MIISGEDRSKLLDAWIGATTKSELEIFIGITLDRDTKDFIPDGTLREQIWFVITYIDRQQNVMLWRKILSALLSHQEYSLNQALQRVCPMILEGLALAETPPALGVSPFDTMFIHSNQAFINRNDFRELIRQLNGPNGSFRIIKVHGEQFSGVSHSRQYLRHLKRTLNAPSRLVVIDLDPPDPSRYQPTSRTVLAPSLTELRQIAQDIRAEAGIEGAPLSECPLPIKPREIHGLAAWLLRELKRIDGDIWVVLDSLDRIDPNCQDAHSFIAAFADGVAQNCDRVRLFLLGYNRPFYGPLEPFVRSEQVKGCPWRDAREIEVFFATMARQFNVDEVKLNSVISQLQQRMEEASRQPSQGGLEVANLLHWAAAEIVRNRP